MRNRCSGPGASRDDLKEFDLLSGNNKTAAQCVGCCPIIVSVPPKRSRSTTASSRSRKIVPQTTFSTESHVFGSSRWADQLRMTIVTFCGIRGYVLRGKIPFAGGDFIERT